MPSIDNQININSVNTNSEDHKTLLQKIFGGRIKTKKIKTKIRPLITKTFFIAKHEMALKKIHLLFY